MRTGSRIVARRRPDGGLDRQASAQAKIIIGNAIPTRWRVNAAIVAREGAPEIGAIVGSVPAVTAIERTARQTTKGRSWT
jgi:hypothetical protein